MMNGALHSSGQARKQRNWSGPSVSRPAQPPGTSGSRRLVAPAAPGSRGPAHDGCQHAGSHRGRTLCLRLRCIEALASMGWSFPIADGRLRAASRWLTRRPRLCSTRAPSRRGSAIQMRHCASPSRRTTRSRSWSTTGDGRRYSACGRTVAAIVQVLAGQGPDHRPTVDHEDLGVGPLVTDQAGHGSAHQSTADDEHVVVMRSVYQSLPSLRGCGCGGMWVWRHSALLLNAASNDVVGSSHSKERTNRCASCARIDRLLEMGLVGPVERAASLDEYADAGQRPVRRERRGTASMSCHSMACLSWSPSSLPGGVIGAREQPHRGPNNEEPTVDPAISGDDSAGRFTECSADGTGVQRFTESVSSMMAA